MSEPNVPLEATEVKREGSAKEEPTSYTAETNRTKDLTPNELELNINPIVKEKLNGHDERSSCYCWTFVSAFYRQALMTCVASLGALAIGTIYAFPAVALARWEDEKVVLTTAQTTWFVSTPVVVSMVMSAVSGMLLERLGVRVCLASSMLVLGITWVMIGQATTFTMLLIARIIQGVVVSMFTVVMGVYPAEVSEVRWRGIIIGVAEVMLLMGSFLIYVGGLFLHPKQLAYTLVITLIPQFIPLFLLRETPLWLMRQNRVDEVVRSLKCLRDENVDIKAELEKVRTTVHLETTERPTPAKQLLLIRKPIYLKPIIICIMILFFKELTGQYAVVAYTVNIFRMAGSSLDPYLCAVVMGTVRLIPGFLFWLIVERVKRRLLLSLCLVVTGVSLTILGTTLWIWPESNKDLGPYVGWVPIVSLSIVTLAYGIGVGPISWTIVAELLPSQVRNVGAGIVNSCFSLFQFLVGLTFPFIVEQIGMGGVFILYSVCSFCGVIFMFTCLPETRGQSYAEIQTKFDSSRNHC